MSDELWWRIEPLLPKERTPGKKGGRPRVSNRQVLTGILFVLRAALPWQILPLEMGRGSGSTCWRRVPKLDTTGDLERLLRAESRGPRAADGRPLEFLARVLVHIPDKGQVTTRYYGWYANRLRGMRREAEPAGAETPVPRVAAPRLAPTASFLRRDDDPVRG